ncbi:MAG: vWA domain-containing protein, partial [Methyloligellaceae bacterium]
MQCDIRFANPWEAAGSPEKVEVVWPDGVREEIEFNAYNPNENTTAWLLLFDRSQSLDKKSVEVIRDDFGKIISGLRSKEKLGIASFAENFQLLSPIGAPRGELVNVLKDLKPVGKKTYLYQSALEGLEVLRNYRAKRKALVIISDGKSEDGPNVTYQDIIAKANELGVVVYGIGYSEKPENDVFLNELQEIARRTQGPSQKEQLHREDAR